jgi:hypothetical protein
LFKPGCLSKMYGNWEIAEASINLVTTFQFLSNLLNCSLFSCPSYCHRSDRWGPSRMYVSQLWLHFYGHLLNAYNPLSQTARTSKLYEFQDNCLYSFTLFSNISSTFLFCSSCVRCPLLHWPESELFKDIIVCARK